MSGGYTNIHAPPPSPIRPPIAQESPENEEPLQADDFANEWRNFQLPPLAPIDNSEYLETIEKRFTIPVLIQQIRSMQ